MPAIDPNVLQSVFYIYPDKGSAQIGEHIGGTGFFVAREFEELPGWQQLYAATNRHCIKKSGSKVVLRVARKDGTPDFFETRAEDWTEHPDLHDVAVCAIDIVSPSDYAYNYISMRRLFLTPETVASEAIGPGDDVFMVGRFFTEDGKERNLPTVHFGNLSRMNGPITDEYGIRQDSFLVEMRSMPTFSGSPVFLFINPLMPRPPLFILPTGTRQHYFQHRHGPWLLGIDWCHITHNMRVKEPDGQGGLQPVEPAQYVEAVSGMAGVIPAWRIKEVLDLPELVAQRKDAAELLKTNRA